MKRILASLFALLVSLTAHGASDWLTPDGMTKVMEGVDDGTYHVNLGHTFPYYGGVFTDAWMSSNGVIILYDPTTQFGNSQTYNSYCCSGQDLTTQTGSFSFMLAPLWTDLRDANLTNDDGYYYKTDKGGSSFLWYNVTEYGTTNTNTFQANLWPDGSFDFLYDEVDVVQHQTFIGFSGDTSLGDATKLYYGNNISDSNLGGMGWWDQKFSGQGYSWYGQDGGYESSLDCSNALNDSQCPGYEQAYYDQQCSSDPLYDSGCSGYEQAYYDQQCSYDNLYDQGCPGYQGALAAQDAAGTDFIFGDDISDFYDTEPVVDNAEIFLTSADNTGMFIEEDMLGFEEDYGYDNAIVYEEFTEDFGAMDASIDAFFDEPIVEDFSEEIYDDPIVESVGEDMFVEEEMYAESEGLDPQEEQVEIVEENILEEEVISNVDEALPIEVVEPAVKAETQEAADAPSVDAVAIALSEVSLVETAATTLVATNNLVQNNSEPSSSIQSNDSREEQEVQNDTEAEKTAENNYTDDAQQEQYSLPDNGLVEVDSSNIVQQDLTSVDTGTTDSIYSNIVLQEEDASSTPIIDFSLSIEPQDSAAGSIALDSSYSSVVEYEQEDFDNTSTSSIDHEDSAAASVTLDDSYSNIVSQEEDSATSIPTIDFLLSIEQQDSASGSVALDNSYSSVVEYEQEDTDSYSMTDFSANQFDTTTDNIQSDIVNPTMDFVQSNISLAIEQSSNLISPNEQGENSVNNESQQMDSSFGTIDATFDTAIFNMLVDPTMLASDIEMFVAESPLEQVTQQEESTVNFQMESSTPQQDTGFAEQQNQSFSTGQSIADVLNNVQPNYSQFNVAPPSQEEQQTTDKAEAQASNMTEDQLESNLDEFTNNMQDSGGFTDQSLTVFLMGRNSGFSQYQGQLQDVSFYTDRGMPGGRMQNDRNSMLRMMGTDNKHEEMIAGQYR